MTCYWYRNNHDGTAAVYDDCTAIRAQIDANPSDWYITAEGAILHGGVLATAFERKIEITYDSVHWLNTKELRPMGERITTKITATSGER